MIKIGQASRDERMRYSGGIAGDQDGKEVAIREWYNRPWNKVLRCRDSKKAEKIAQAMEKACRNDYIGYDQSQRTTLYSLCKANGWRIEDIETSCETDCSALVAVCVNAAGIKVSGDIYTGNEANALLRTEEFELLTAPKYLLSDEYLRRGDILLYEFHHTAIALQDGKKAGVNKYTAVEYPLGWNISKEGKWWYAETPHSHIAGRWAFIEGRWYVFDMKGFMITEWFKQGDDWYYLNPADGAMISNQWVDIDGRSYYFTQSGLMARNGYIEDASEKLYFFVDDEGRYIKELDTDTPDLSKYEVIE
jgi:gametolysin